MQIARSVARGLTALLVAGCAAVQAPSSAAPASPERATWSRHDLGVDGPALYRILPGGPGYIGVGQGGERGGPSGIWTSEDALTWTAVGPSGDRAFSAVAAGGPGFVAISASPASAWTSPDGVTWTEGPGGDFADTVLLGLAATDGMLVAVGQRAIWSSTDGSTWTEANLGPHESTVIDVAAGGPGFVAVGSEVVASMETKGAVWTSVDGRAWERLEDQPAFERAELRAVAADGPTLVATGWRTDLESGVFFTPSAWTSTDGRNWRRATVNDATLPTSGSEMGALEGAVMASVARGPSGWISAGTALAARTDAMAVDAALWTSADGATWERVAPELQFEAGMSTSMEFGALTVTANGDRVVVVGRTSGPQTTLWVSPAQPGGSVPAPRPSEPAATGEPGTGEPGDGAIDATPAPPAPASP